MARAVLCMPRRYFLFEGGGHSRRAPAGRGPQSTSAQSQFLDACRSRNRGDLEAEQLVEATVRLGFADVIDAFHVSRGGQPTQTRFFVDERASRQSITLTGHLLELANGQQAKVLPPELDTRWNLEPLAPSHPCCSSRGRHLEDQQVKGHRGSHTGPAASRQPQKSGQRWLDRTP